MIDDRPILGITLMLGFCILAPMADAVAKLLGDSLPLAQIVLIRFLIQVAILIPILWWTGREWRMPPRVMWLLLLRTILNIVAIAAMFTALVYLDLADAVAIVFVMPFFLLILGKVFLNEQVGARRMMACVIGFFGTLLVIQPSFAAVGLPALLPVFVAAVFSIFMLITRQISKAADPISQQAVSGAMAVALLAPLLWIGGTYQMIPLTAIGPDSDQWSLLFALGLLGTAAHLLMNWSLRYAPSATLAPMQYLEIPFATVLGFFIFDDLPDDIATLGIAIIMVTGLYIIGRERAIARSLVRSDV